MAHYFTLEEANKVVQAIRPMMKEILEIRQKIIATRPDVWPILQSAAGNGGSLAASKLAIDFMRLDGLVRQVHSTGAILKDINQGLLDFLSLRDGREVYLCWQYDEEEIKFWHDLHTGYAGRRPV